MTYKVAAIESLNSPQVYNAFFSRLEIPSDFNQRHFCQALNAQGRTAVSAKNAQIRRKRIFYCGELKYTTSINLIQEMKLIESHSKHQHGKKLKLFTRSTKYFFC